MPTFETRDQFRHEYRRLRRDQQALFQQALHEFIQVLSVWEQSRRPGLPQFPRNLGVKRMIGRGGIMEFAWTGDGRATWELGTPLRPGIFHIVWRRIGTHTIYEKP